MRTIEIHQSVLIVWDIANAEACLAGSTEIEPVHLVLGLLKVVDSRFKKHLLEKGLSREVIESVLDVAARCRARLNLSDGDVMAARRGLRESLRGLHALGEFSEPARVGRLHRSGFTKYLFHKAGRLVLKTGDSSMTLVHLIEVLANNWPTEATPFVSPLCNSGLSADEEWPDVIPE